MQISGMYKIGSIVIVCLWFLTVLVKIVLGQDYMSYIISLTLVLSLIVLIKYAYDTSLIAKEVWYPAAHFVVGNNEDDRYDISFNITSIYKLSLKCWCKLNITVYDQPVTLGGFYNAEHSIDIQPLGKVHGHFRIQDILSKTKYDVRYMIDKFNDDDAKKQLYMEIEFWYETLEGDLKNTNPKQPYYFNFKKTQIVLDV